MGQIISKIKLSYIIFLGLILRLVLLVISNSHPDVGNHLDWGIRFWQYGPRTFYDQSTWSVSWPNQPFGTIYLFAFISLVKDSLYGLLLYLNNTFPLFPSRLIWIMETNLHVWLVKLPFIISDLGLTVLIYRIVKKYNPQFANLAAILFLFNPVIIYNSTIWGQTDSLINFLALLGLYKVFQKKYFSGIFFFMISFTFKMSLIIYLPIFFILLYKNINEYKKIISYGVITLGVIIITSLPFWYGSNPILWLIKLYSYYVYGHQGNMLNGNAFNIWFLIFGADLTRPDNITIFGQLSAKFVSYSIATITFLAIWLKYFLSSTQSLRSTLYVCFLTGFSAFIIMTNMHERYLYPIFPIITILLFIKPKLISIFSYITLSLIHLINLYNLWFYPDIPVLKSMMIGNDFLFGKTLSVVLFIFYSHYLLDYFNRDQT